MQVVESRWRVGQTRTSTRTAQNGEVQFFAESFCPVRKRTAEKFRPPANRRRGLEETIGVLNPDYVEHTTVPQTPGNMCSCG
jgi:hypothetical protein